MSFATYAKKKSGYAKYCGEEIKVYFTASGYADEDCWGEVWIESLSILGVAVDHQTLSKELQAEILSLSDDMEFVRDN